MMNTKRKQAFWRIWGKVSFTTRVGKQGGESWGLTGKSIILARI